MRKSSKREARSSKIETRGVDIATAARGWLATPFRHCGREKGVGVDCLGVLIGVAVELGLMERDDRVYSRVVDPDVLLAGLKEHLDEATGDYEPGDVLVFRVKGVAQHIGICTAAGFIHAWETVGQVVESRLDRYWRSQIAHHLRFGA